MKMKWSPSEALMKDRPLFFRLTVLAILTVALESN
jgi:hypothetical protein